MTLAAGGNIGMGNTTSPETLLELESGSPYITLHNSAHEDSDGGRESRLNFKGEQSGGEETTLARMEVSHDGAADDEKGQIVFSTNDGSDGDSPTIALTIDSSGTVIATGRVVSGTGTITASSDNFDVSGINVLFVDITGDIVVGGLTGGADGQILHIACRTNRTNTCTLEHVEGLGDQDIYLRGNSDSASSTGGWTLVCDGSDWYECSFR
jgi:hypothetical protein